MSALFKKINSGPFRYERKFITTQIDRHHIENLIKYHPELFSEIYHERKINSIYFDSLDMHSYYNNMCGTRERIKIRIRWYGDLFSLIEKPVLELKIKKGHVGSKKQFFLKPFKLDSNISLNSILRMLRLSDIPDCIIERFMFLQMAIITRYSRKYFQSSDKKYRLTIDWDMEYYTIENVNNTFRNKKHDYLTTILELKYPIDNDDYAQIITNHLPFRFSKNSKFEVGIKNLIYYR